MKKPEIDKSYDPLDVEKKWYEFWEKKGFFHADAHSQKPAYCIVIPPPNVTGALHMGHALVNTLQDILVRWKRMNGYEALWVPGTDHAGIATQSVVERHLLATTGKKRYDFSREEFVKIVWEWKEKYEGRIIGQLKKLGSSCDWERTRFTMDKGCNHAVKVLFKNLFDEGLIYRGDYLVNWDPLTQTALADDEVEYEERPSFLWHFKYPLKDGSGFVTIATTRPETMLGDVAVAVSPDDERYVFLHGKSVILPIMNREIPIIVDPFVDKSFGSGVVKITPAHDATDYLISFHHKLPLINIFTPNAHINENGGPFQGLSREKARMAVVEKMEELGLVEKIERHHLRVGVSYRSKAIIEPYLSKQWFIKMSSFVEPLKQAILEKQTKLIPPLWEHTFFHWINNLRDWCISRQLWWGHRIPVWHHKTNSQKMICHIGEGLPPEVLAEPGLWEQDNDVLDTWFSSALWPFSTLGWPEKTPELEKFYPNSVLVTGHDILFFWVARMMVMGKYALGQLPFPEVFLHGLIYGKSYWRENKEGGITYVSPEEKKKYDLDTNIPSDVRSKWEKLSKSKGNVIDPLDLIEEYGTDAVRMSLSSCANQSPQIDLDRRRFEEFKNFANKIWNGARFVFMNLEGLSSGELSYGLDISLLSLEDHWILSRLNRINSEVNKALSSYNFENAAKLSYDFFWKEFCAYYVEIAKPTLFGKRGNPSDKKNKQKLLVIVLCNAIRLLHPLAPFITEELFQTLKSSFPDIALTITADPYTQEMISSLLQESVMRASYPQIVIEKDMNEEIEQEFSLVEEIVHSIRTIRGEMKIPPQIATDLYILDPKDLLRENGSIISSLVKIGSLRFVREKPSALVFSAFAAVGDITLIVPLPDELAERERARLEKEKEKLIQKIQSLQTQLQDIHFLNRAKPDVIQKQKEQLLNAEKELKILSDKL